LGCYKALHDTLQAGLRLRRLLLRRWVIRDSVLEIRRLRLRGIEGNGVVISVGKIRMISPTRVISV